MMITMPIKCNVLCVLYGVSSNEYTHGIDEEEEDNLVEDCDNQIEAFNTNINLNFLRLILFLDKSKCSVLILIKSRS